PSRVRAAWPQFRHRRRMDSILIDEARTPLIISGASEESTDKYARVNRIIPRLEKGEELSQQELAKLLDSGKVAEEEKEALLAELAEAGSDTQRKILTG